MSKRPPIGREEDQRAVSESRLIIEGRLGRLQLGGRFHFNDQTHFFCNQMGKPESILPISAQASAGYYHVTPSGDGVNAVLPESPELVDARKTLLEHYTTQLTNHYIYLLTSLAAIVGLLGSARMFAQILYLSWFSVAEGFFTAAALWILLKCFFYGACSRWVLRMVSRQMEGNMLQLLDDRVAGKNRFTRFMNRPYLVFLPLSFFWPGFTILWELLVVWRILALN